MSDIKLLPCPFCGGEAHKRIAFPVDADGMEMNMYIVGCETCDIEFSWLWDEDVVIELWNTRKPMDRIVEQLEEHKKESHDDYLGLGCDDDFGAMCAYSHAIDIVKAGGKV